MLDTSYRTQVADPAGKSTYVPFDSVGDEIIGKIAYQLIEVTGQKDCPNIADLPVIIRYANRLAATSRRMYNVVNSLEMRGVFIRALAARFTDIYVLPKELCHPEQSEWLKDYLLASSWKKCFEDVLSIRNLAIKLLNLAKQKHHSLDATIPPLAFSVTGCFTKVGYELVIANQRSVMLCTPLSYFTLLSYPSQDQTGIYEFCESLIKETAAQLTFGGVGSYRVKHADGKYLIKDVDIKDYRGLNQLLFPVESLSQYSIKTIGNRSVSSLSSYELYEDRQPWLHRKLVWEILTSTCKEQDAIKEEMLPEKKPEPAVIVPQEEVPGIEEVIPWDDCDDIDKLEALVYSILNQLWTTSEEHKYFTHTILMYSIILDEVSKSLFGICGSYNSFGIDYKNGALVYYGDQLNIQLIATAYQYTFHSKRYWQPAIFKDYLDQVNAQSEEDFELYTKARFDEDMFLFKAVILKLKLEKDAMLFSRLKDDKSMLCLWIRKSKKSEVTKKLNLKFVEPEQK